LPAGAIRFAIAPYEFWPDQNDPTAWTPLDANTANTRRLTDGTELVNGLALGQRISLVWSDNALYVFQYTGSASVYDSRKVSTNCGGGRRQWRRLLDELAHLPPL